MPPGGTLNELLRADAFASDPLAAKRQAVALRAAKPSLERCFDRLAAGADVPIPDEVQPEPAHPATTTRPGSMGVIPQLALGALGVVVAVVGLVWSSALIFIGVGLVVAALYWLVSSRRAEQERQQSLEGQRAWEERRLAEATDARATAIESSNRAREARARLRQLLA